MDDCLIRLDQDIVMHRSFYDRATAILLDEAKAKGSISWQISATFWAHPENMP